MSLRNNATLILVLVAMAAQANSKTIWFSGREWNIRPSGRGQGPGPNNWSEENVWLDENGRLHMKISRIGNEWFCGELYTTEKLPFGRYQFQVEGQIDQLDQNVVLGLFNYPTPDVGPDRTNEIDIEFAKWGIPNSKRAGYTVYPSRLGSVAHKTFQFDFSLSGTYTTHSFDWRSDHILFSSQHGHQNNNRDEEFASWDFRPVDAAVSIPQSPLRIHMNIWLNRGEAPVDQREVEIIIHSFQFRKQERLGVSHHLPKNRKFLLARELHIDAKETSALGDHWFDV